MTLLRPALWRRLLRHPRLRLAACWTIHCYIRLVYCTNRWHIEGGEAPRRLLADGRMFIGAFWHGRMLMIPLAWARMAPMNMLISAHRDGRIIADAVAYFGIDAIAGSTRRGGSAALRNMLKKLREGACVAITPDGPRGPAMRVGAGIVNAARLAQAPIVPITYATSRRRILASWDRFHVALPFGRGIFLWGEPIEVAADADDSEIERIRRFVEARMIEMVEEADRRVGHKAYPLAAERSRPRQPEMMFRNATDPRFISFSPTQAGEAQGGGKAAEAVPAGSLALMLPLLYRTLTRPLPALVILYLEFRRRRGKEDGSRLRERRGHAGLARPSAPLVWIHAASLGEATAMLRLIDRLLETRPELEILVTTGTVTSARLLATRLPARARHQFVPVDLPGWVAHFLDHWRPDLALWVESELWPNLVLATHARGIPMLLVNGRLSARSYRRWRRCPGLIRPILGAFARCLAQDEEQARRLRRLGARDAVAVGDLKSAGGVLPVDPMELSRLRRQIGTRPIWLAASTHAGEEEITAAAHRRLAADHPDLLTVITPRHPARGDAVAAMLTGQGLVVSRRSHGDPVTAETAIYLADTLGELGLLYRLAGIALIGGSLTGRGGHNPFEAARLDCAILHGPDMSNCAGMAAALAGAGAAQVVTGADELGIAVSALLADHRLRARRAAAAARAAAAGEGVLDRVLDNLAPWFDRLAPSDPRPKPPVLGAAVEVPQSLPA